MMTSILIFSLKSMACSAVFTGYYLLALKNAPTNNFNRFYLLAAAILSLALPFVQFSTWHINPVTLPDIPILNISGVGAEETGGTAYTGRSFDWSLVPAAAYFTITGIMILNLLLQYAWFYNLKRKGKQVRKDGFLLVETDDKRAPFSFMNVLFWPALMRHDNQESKGILLHELAHIRQYHTLDKMAMQLMLAFSWLNPFNWLIKKELWLQHEFLADKYAIGDRDGETFAKMLLYGATQSSGRSLISPFFQSPVKRRLQMLTSATSSSNSGWRRLLSVPVALLAVVLLSARTPQPAVATPAKEKITIVLDAAHGGEDIGGKSVYGYQEKDITLAISKKLVALSGEYNIEIVTTRAADATATLQERMRISNSTEAAAFISLHINKGVKGSKGNDGYELGVNPGNEQYPQSLLLASAIADKLKKQSLHARIVDYGKAYVMRESKHPALLMECGNLDDADNMKLLHDEARTEALCRNILAGIATYAANREHNK